MMAVRWLGATEPMARVLFYYFLLSTVMAVPFAVMDWQPLPPGAWIWLAALGFAQVFSQALIVLIASQGVVDFGSGVVHASRSTSHGER